MTEPREIVTALRQGGLDARATGEGANTTYVLNTLPPGATPAQIEARQRVVQQSLSAGGIASWPGEHEFFLRVLTRAAQGGGTEIYISQQEISQRGPGNDLQDRSQNFLAQITDPVNRREMRQVLQNAGIALPLPPTEERRETPPGYSNAPSNDKGMRVAIDQSYSYEPTQQLSPTLVSAMSSAKPGRSGGIV